MDDLDCDIVIVGGGPFGLMMANELGRRGITACLFDQKEGTAFNPQANATQARTMEHYRRLGFADEIRSMGLPEEFPTDIAYFTRYATHELARFSLPSAREARERISSMSGSWSAAELPHRVSQKFVEQVLRRQAEALPGISVNYGWAMSDFADHGSHVVTTVRQTGGGAVRQLKSRFMAAGDGARSSVRRQLGFRFEGETGVVRDFFGGRMFALYLDAPQFYDMVPHAPAWMNVTFNRDRRAFMCAVDGKGEFAFHTQLRDGEDAEKIDDAQALAMFQSAVGKPVEARIISRDTWTAGHALVAEHFQKGNVFLGGDAVHLFTPAGGLGYNTAVDDAVNLAWKIAATIQGTAGPKLLDSYELERKPVAVRNTGYARGFAESLGQFRPGGGLEDDGAEAETLRAEAGAYLEKHGRAEFNIPGVTFGARYDGSPVIFSDEFRIQEDVANAYVPTAAPGGRAPHLWLGEEQSLFDEFGFEWTLLRIGPDAPSAEAFVDAARLAGLSVKVLSISSDALADLYEAPLALIRPDQIVAWRGEDGQAAAEIFRRVLGHGSE